MDENFSAAHRSARLQGIPAGSKHRAHQLEDLPDCLIQLKGKPDQIHSRQFLMLSRQDAPGGISHHVYLAAFVLRLRPEEARLADGDFVQEVSKFPIAARVRDQTVELFSRLPQVEDLHAPAAPVGQQVELFFRIVVSRHVVNDVADLPVDRLNR